MLKTIALAHGDGIGPEVVNEGKKILDLIAQYTNFEFNFVETPIGGEVWKRTGTNLPDKSFNQMQESDAILFGAIGLPDLAQGVAESAILKMRQGLNLYVNLRPVKLYEPLYDICPLKPEFYAEGIDITIVRENTESLYAQIGGMINAETAVNTMVYTRKAVERLIDYGFAYAERKGHTEIISVDKANVLACSRFWREIFTEKGKKFPKLKQTNFYVDAFCQWLIRSPSTIQTVVTENMFGDIISDEAAYLIGSMGMAASGNINPNSVSMYEPIHGSAPDIARQNIANPIGAILSVKMMCEESFHDIVLGTQIENAVIEALWEGRTLDIYPRKGSKVKDVGSKKYKKCTTQEMGTLIAEKLKAQLKP
ncbi:MAG: 3-isopropylmalate dehydrogenase [Promethearchaeota archaeon]|nr:MAG: 3-isopropylmalate dehydrogenase [Candidatus Lokiarchaeota archaeon]